MLIKIFFNSDKIATIVVNPSPSLTENYTWIPETSDNVVPGLDSLLTYTQCEYATVTALQNSITNINNTIDSEIQNLQIEINNIEISNPSTQNVSKESYYHTSHTDFLYQRNNTKNDDRRQFVIQNHYFTCQREGNNELAIQALNIIVADLQTQINNLSSGSGGGGGGDDPNIDTVIFILIFIHLIYIQTCWNEYLYISPEVIKPCPKMHFSKHPPDTAKNIKTPYKTKLGVWSNRNPRL